LKYAAVVLLAALAAALGLLAGDRVASEETTTVSVTTVQTETVTATARDSGVPARVLQKRVDMLRAAEARDYDALAELADPKEFSYSFGVAVPGGPAQYWRELAAEGNDPLEALALILRMPYTLATGHFVWPFAYDKTADTLTDYERELLEPLGTSFAGESYLGWRAGIRPDGRWVYFVAGD
jgi:hypothetical protein